MDESRSRPPGSRFHTSEVSGADRRPRHRQSRQLAASRIAQDARDRVSIACGAAEVDRLTCRPNHLRSKNGGRLCADGQGIDAYAQVLEPLIAAKTLPLIVLVGVHNGGYLAVRPDFDKYDSKKDFRASRSVLAFSVPGRRPDQVARTSNKTQVSFFSGSSGPVARAVSKCTHPSLRRWVLQAGSDWRSSIAHARRYTTAGDLARPGEFRVHAASSP